MDNGLHPIRLEASLHETIWGGRQLERKRWKQLPLGDVRVRRDFKRALSLFTAIAVISRGGIPGRNNINLEDYAAAYRILEPALFAAAGSARACRRRTRPIITSTNRLCMSASECWRLS